MFQTDQRFRQITISQSPDLAAVNAGGIRDISPNTDRWFRTACRNLAAYVGDLRVDQIAAADIQAWHHANLETKSINTANGYLRAVKTIYSRLYDRGIVAINPAAYVPFAPSPPARPRAVAKVTYKAMRQAADNLRDLALLDLLWSTGARLSGVLSMRIDKTEIWIDDRGRCCLAALVTSKRKTRYVYAADIQAQTVRRYIDQRPPAAGPALLLTAAGSGLTIGGAQSALRKIRKAAGIPPGVPANAHGFRHAFAIRKLDAGYDLATVAAWLGHADPAFTAKTYAVRREDQLRSRFFE